MTKGYLTGQAWRDAHPHQNVFYFCSMYGGGDIMEPLDYQLYGVPDARDVWLGLTARGPRVGALPIPYRGLSVERPFHYQMSERWK